MRTSWRALIRDAGSAAGGVLIATITMSTAHAGPAPILVGTGACDFNNLSSAISAAAAQPGPDVIHVSNNHTGQALKIGAQDLTIIGGYASCDSAQPTPGAVTTISGFGGDADSVLEITGAGQRTLVNLLIRDGDEVDGEDGGGIDFAGEGLLGLLNVQVASNRAGFGGGIAFVGAGASAAILSLGENVLVQNNIAAQSGGGVRVSGNARLSMLADRSAITGNEALGLGPDSGYGGGIQIRVPARAEIASPGFVNIGAISFNRAKYGAGLALIAGDASDGNASAVLYSSDPQRPVRIDHNIASVAGGGVYLDVNNTLGAGAPTFLCAYEYRIDHNQAPDGAALFIGNDVSLGSAFGALVDLNVADTQTAFRCGVGALPPRPSAVSCAPGVICNSIDANRVAQANGQAADGAIIEITEDATLRANRTALVGNQGSDAVHSLTSTSLQLSNVLIADNTFTGRAIASDARINLRNLTIAGNTLGLSDVLSLTNDIVLRESIVWQPGHVVLGSPHGDLDGANVLSNDPTSVPVPASFALDPRFIDPGRSDFRLRAASPAIDIALPEFSDAFDLDGQARQQDLSINNGLGPRDLGAYERPQLDPLVLNGAFSADTAHWLDVTAGVSAFDPAENAPESPTGGAMNFHWQNTPVVMTRVVSRAQCLHLPLPGTYRLNAAARTTGGTAVAGQNARLNWALRLNGTEACATGAIDAQGDLAITSGTAWTRASTPATITVPAQQWTRQSSVTVSLVMVATGVTAPAGMHGWFDDVTLTLDVENLFADGFE